MNARGTYSFFIAFLFIIVLVAVALALLFFVKTGDAQAALLREHGKNADLAILLRNHVTECTRLSPGEMEACADERVTRVETRTLPVWGCEGQAQTLLERSDACPTRTVALARVPQGWRECLTEIAFCIANAKEGDAP